MKILCVDVGGTAIKHCVIEEDLQISRKDRMIPDASSLESYVESLGQIYDLYRDEVDGVSFCMPGICDPRTGYFYTGGAYDDIVHELDLKGVLAKRIDKPLSFENDAKSAGYAELGYGVLQDHDNAILITLGHAVGGCIIFDHKIVYGSHFSAGEFSFVHMDCHNPEELWAWRNGREGLLKRVQEHTGSKEELSGVEIFEKAQGGDEQALAGLRDFVRELCIQLYDLQVMFDPEIIALGGGISERQLLFELIDECFRDMKENSSFFLWIPQVVPCRFHNDANLIGAYHKFLLQHKNDHA